MDGWMVLSSVFATYLLYSGVDWTGKVDKYVRIFLLPFTGIPRFVRLMRSKKRSYKSNSYKSRVNTRSKAAKFIKIHINRNQITVVK